MPTGPAWGLYPFPASGVQRDGASPSFEKDTYGNSSKLPSDCDTPRLQYETHVTPVGRTVRTERSSERISCRAKRLEEERVRKARLRL